jgi:diguanylate cyclase (GGDEF)-like protein
MAVSYTQTLSTDRIVAEIEALLDWKHDVLRNAFFPADKLRDTEEKAPEAMLIWCRAQAEKGSLDKQVVDRMALVHAELCKQAKQLSQGGITAGLYDTFENQFNAYVTQIRRLQQDLTASSISVDGVTGLRTLAGMQADIKKEQDRFDRKGTSFSIACIHLDGLPELQARFGKQKMDLIYAHAAHVISRSMRSFDDAYYADNGEYLIVLKHIDFLDACAVMDRLRGEIEHSPAYVDGDKLKVTASFGISEALAKESHEVAIEHAKSALMEAKASGGNRVMEFREMSALEQYAKDLNRK